MSGGSKQTQQTQQQSTTSNTVDPQELAMLQANYAGAQQKASTLTPYTGQLTAGFTPTQLQAQGVLGDVATDPTYQNQIAGAGSAVQGILGNPVNGTVTSTPVTPSTITGSTVTTPSANASQVAAPSTVSANPITAGLLATTDLSPYMNPYTSDVINTTNNQIGQQRQTAQMQDNQKAAAESAFGGSRSGVANALTNQYYDQDTASTDAGLNQANFSQAQAAATGDINRTLTADTTNAGNNLNASEFNTTTGLNAGEYNANNAQAVALANQNAALQSGEYNATNNQNAQLANQTAGINTGEYNSSANTAAQQASINNALASQGLQLNAAGQLVSTAQAGLNTATTQGGILSAVGDAQQAQNQTALTNAYNAYMQGQQLTVEQQQLLNSALGLIPNQQTVNSSGTGSGTATTSSSPGLSGILGGLGSVAQGAALFA